MGKEFAAERRPADGPAGEDEPAPRAWLTHADGRREPVPADALHGLDEFAAAWSHNVADPHAVSFEGWQQTDEDHQPGAGSPAYRIVFKTIRTVTHPAVDFDTTNLRVRLNNGPITTGEPRYVGALAERVPGSFLQPEWGTVKTTDNGERGYATEPAMNVHVDNHEDVTPWGNYVEILYAVPHDTAPTFADTLAAGRAGVAPLLASLEMQFGTRLLGPTLAEEVGEMFNDGHWIRKLGGRVIRLEAQASMDHLPGQRAAQFLGHTVERQVDRTPEQRRRVRIASQWYLRGMSEADATTRYIAFWLVLEALELDENINIAPLKQALAAILGQEPSTVADRVGRLFRTRSKLVHGKIHTVAQDDISAVATMAAILLEKHLLGRVSLQRRQQLAETVSTSGASALSPQPAEQTPAAARPDGVRAARAERVGHPDCPVAGPNA